MKAEHGIVKIHAHTILPATPQRTADSFCTEPTPTMAPVIVCVVETGTPRPVARNSVIAPPVSAQKPPTGLSLVMRLAHGLDDAPAAEQRAEAHRDVAREHHPERQVRIGWPIMPAAISSIQMMPMVFCASLPPWPRL